jgi:hypothetical protein
MTDGMERLQSFESLIFIFSVVIMFASSVLLAKSLATTRAERFWVFIASMASYLGIISVGTSLFAQLKWPVWFFGQVLTFIITIFFLKAFNHTPLKLNSFKSWSTSALELWPNTRQFLLSLRFGSLIGLTCIVMFLLVSLLTQIIAPISGFNERMYHASRVLYFIQNHSVFPYETHNDRQIMFNYGAELFFLWPVLFTKSELIGRIVFWLAYPFSAIGMFFLLRELNVKRNVLILSLLVFVSTPIVAFHSVGIRSEMWLVVFVLGLGFWTVRFCKMQESIEKNLFFAGFFLILCINVKSISLSMIISVLVLPLLKNRAGRTLSSFKAACLGICTSFVVSGCFVIMGNNLIHYGHPLGSKSFRDLHSSDLSIRQIYTHAVRMPFLLLEMPAVPSYQLRRYFNGMVNVITNNLSASKPLKDENDEKLKKWLGMYFYRQPKYAKKFSLGGIVWMPLLGIASVRFIREVMKTFPKVQIDPLLSLVALEVPFVGGISFLIRWMTGAQVPERFLVAPYALGLVISTVLVSEFLSKRRYVQVAGWFLIIWMVYGSSHMRLVHLRDSLHLNPGRLDEPFTIVMQHIPSRARILLAGKQGVRDYPLFAPRDRYRNRVISWGKLPFDAARMQDLIETNRITHILIQDDQQLGFQREIAEWASTQPYLRPILLPTIGMHLFVVGTP